MARFRDRIIGRGALRRLAVLAVVLAAGCAGGYLVMIRMPGRSHTGPLPPLTGDQIAMRARMRDDVATLAATIGPRSVDLPEAMAAAAEFLDGALAAAGYDVARQVFDVEGVSCVNLEATRIGATRPSEIVVVGAHYDSVTDDQVVCPGANDNASGTAAVLELARRFADVPLDRTVRFVLFTNEEPPWFQTSNMGSLVYAAGCRERDDDIVAMLSLETIGCYLDAPGTQKYPRPLSLLYPSTGDFIAFVGNVGSRRLVRRAISTFRRRAAFPSEGAALPSWLPGIGWSDQWAFWQHDYRAIMVTDTAPFRYPHYHRLTDTPDQLDYDRMTRVVDGVAAVVEELATADAAEPGGKADS